MHWPQKGTKSHKNSTLHALHIAFHSPGRRAIKKSPTFAHFMNVIGSPHAIPHDPEEISIDRCRRVGGGGAWRLLALGVWRFNHSYANDPPIRIASWIRWLPGRFSGRPAPRVVYLSRLPRERDLILLGGDYIDRYSGYIAPVMEELGKLKSPLGVFAVQGNRDIRLNRVLTSKELLRQGIRELTNKGCWLERNGSKLWLCGMDDATIGHPDVSAALKGLPPDAVAIAFSHNPDLAESLRDPRIRLMCCGHTHGGQINLPLAGPLFIPSAFGHKYAQGLVQAPVTKVFVTSGVGAAFPPFRFRCPPEIALLTLACA